MKKLILPLLAIAFVFSGCKKEEPVVLGSVTLTPEKKTIKYGEEYEIKYEYSDVGEAKNKSYSWKSANEDIVTVVPTITGGYGKVTAKRIGETTISYTSSDGLVSATAEVIVEPRSNILNGLYYVKGTTENTLKNTISGKFTFDKNASNDKFIVFSDPNSDTLTDLIYEMNNNALEALWVIVKDNTVNRTDVENYITERFANTQKTQHAISFYRNISLPGFPANTVVGTFTNKKINEIDYTFGVKIMDYSYLP
jgi:hypothetical protein